MDRGGWQATVHRVASVHTEATQHIHTYITFTHINMCESCLVVSNCLQPHGLYSPWTSLHGTGAVAARRWNGFEEIAHVQGQRSPSKIVGTGVTLRRDTPRPTAKEKPQQDGRRGKFAFRIKPHSHQRHSQGSNKPCAHQDSETPQRLRQNCV